MKTLRIMVLVAMLAGAAEARAGQVIWDLTGQPGDQSSVAATSVPAGMTAGDITRGDGLVAVAGANSINSRNWEDQATPDPDEYYEFSVGGVGAPMSLASLAYTDNRSATGPFGVRVFFSLDDFASSTLLISYTLDEMINTRHSLDLSGFADLQGTTATVTFRIFAFGAPFLVGTYGLGTEAFWDGNDLPANVVVTTVASAPEPATLLLAVLGLPLVIRVLRRAKPSDLN